MRHAPALLIATFCLLVPASDVRAAYVPWKFSWTNNTFSSTPHTIYSDASKNSSITLSEETLTKAAGSSDVVASDINVFSGADPDHPATFTNKKYTLTMFILDVNSNKSNTLMFSGIINGNISNASSNLTNKFTGITEQYVDLGLHRYTVTIGPFTPPGPPGSSNAGAIGAHAEVRITDIQKTPEPSTLLLALLGAPAIGYRVWRRRRSAH